jgi:hypothetical protein
MPPVEWTSRFASASRSLYAVYRGMANEVPRAEHQIVFAVSAADAPTGWRFYADGDQLIDVVAGCEGPPSSYAPSVVGAYERFVILPPRDDLPQAPPAHSLSVRSGLREVDTLLEVLQRRDLQALTALVSLQDYPCSVEPEPAKPTPPPGSPPPPPFPPPLVPCPPGATPGTAVHGLGEVGCFGRDGRVAERPLLQWAVREGVTLHGVAKLPDGYQPQAGFVVALVAPKAPFQWQSGGLLIRAGRIVAAVDDCGGPQGLYPPARFLVPPPALGQPAPPGRRAGVEILDSIVAAAEAQDAAALVRLTDFEQVGCTVDQAGIGGPPMCVAGEPPGTPIDVLWGAQCEGFPIRRSDLLASYQRLLTQERSIFAVTDRGERESQYSFGRGRYELVFEGVVNPEATPMERSTRNVALIASERGITTLRFGCGPVQPQALISPGLSPDWLIVPPGWQPPT